MRKPISRPRVLTRQSLALYRTAYARSNHRQPGAQISKKRQTIATRPPRLDVSLHSRDVNRVFEINHRRPSSSSFVVVVVVVPLGVCTTGVRRAGQTDTRTLFVRLKSVRINHSDKRSDVWAALRFISSHVFFTPYEIPEANALARSEQPHIRTRTDGRHERGHAASKVQARLSRGTSDDRSPAPPGFRVLAFVRGVATQQRNVFARENHRD